MTKARDLANIISGGFTDADIPNLDTAKITTGTFADARIAASSVSQHVTGEVKPTVTGVSPDTIPNTASSITITGTNFSVGVRVNALNTATGIWYSANTVQRDSATQLTVNITLPVNATTYRIRVENPDGNAGLSSASFLTASAAPTWTTSAGSIGTIAGNFSGTVATVAGTGDSTLAYSETTSVLTNASLAKCTLNSSTGVITTTSFDNNHGTARTHTFTLRITDAEGQTSDREFTLTSSYGSTGGAGFC